MERYTVGRAAAGGHPGATRASRKASGAPVVEIEGAPPSGRVPEPTGCPSVAEEMMAGVECSIGRLQGARPSYASPGWQGVARVYGGGSMRKRISSERGVRPAVGLAGPSTSGDTFRGARGPTTQREWGDGLLSLMGAPGWWAYPTLFLLTIPIGLTGQDVATSLPWLVAEDPSVHITPRENQPATLFQNVTGAFRLTDSSLVVLDCRASELRYFDHAGDPVGPVGGEGQGPGEFRYPYRLFRGAADSLVVVDPSLRRITIFSVDGQGHRTVPFLDAPTYVEPIGAFEDGSFLAFRRPDVGQGPGGVISRGREELHLVTPAGDSSVLVGVLPGIESVGRVTYPFYRRLSIAVASDRIYVGTQDSDTIRILNRYGERMGHFHSVTAPVPPTDSIVRAWVESWGEGGAPQDPWPDVLPAYGRFLLSADDEYLWVSDGYKGEKRPTSWTVYDHSGEAAYRVRLPVRFAPTDVGPDWVLGVSYDDFDVEEIVLYPLREATTAEATSLPAAWTPVTAYGCTIPW